MAAGTVHVPWYATLFRGDRFAQALETIAPVALRYGARDFAVYRSRDDGYKYLQTATFANKLDWDRYWIGPEFMAFREEYTSWYQVPVLYVWHDVLIQGHSEVEEPV